jgi:hypothetical protein
VIEANMDDVVALEAADSGKPAQWSKLDTINGKLMITACLAHGHPAHPYLVLLSGIAAIRYYAGLAGKISGYTVDVGETEKQVVVRREPIGVGE